MDFDEYAWAALYTKGPTDYRLSVDVITGLILGLLPANEGRRYFVTTSLIGWAQA